MPFYDYVCQACGRRIEVMHGVHATGPERCDACGGKLQRLISRPSIHFKGSGWAKMDARTKAAGVGSDDGSSSTSTATDDSLEKAPAAPASSGSPQVDAPPAKNAKGERKARPVTSSADGDQG